MVACSLLFAAAQAQVPTDQELRLLMAEAQNGGAEAEYRLGQYYEAQHDLSQRNPDTASDPTNLLLAYAWFQSAEESGHKEARYARLATEYTLKRFLGDDEFRQAMESVGEWIKDENPPPLPQPPGITQQDAVTELAPEAATETAAGVDESTVPAEAQSAAGETPAPASQQTAAANSRSEAPPKLSRPEFEELLARGTSYLEVGDLVSARSFFKLAAAQGSGAAAMLVGMTYDPNYLELANVVGLRPDAEQAAAWYLKAIEMGADEAEARLQALERRSDRRSR